MHLKTEKVDLKQKKYNFFAFYLSSRHEKPFPILEIIFCLFQCSRNIRWCACSAFLSVRSAITIWSFSLGSLNKFFNDFFFRALRWPKKSET